RQRGSRLFPYTTLFRSHGLRVTDEKTLEIAEPVFAHVGKTLAHALTVAGSPAVSLSGRDAGTTRGVVKDAQLGRVGTVTDVNARSEEHTSELQSLAYLV